MLTSDAMTSLKQFVEESKVPAVQAGQIFKAINSVEPYTFEYQGKTLNAMRIVTEQGTFRTTSDPIMKRLQEYFVEAGNTEPLENVKVVEIQSKSAKNRQYLALQPSD